MTAVMIQRQAEPFGALIARQKQISLQAPLYNTRKAAVHGRDQKENAKPKPADATVDLAFVFNLRSPVSDG